MESQIIIIDLGGQYSHLICRRIRDINVLAEIRQNDVSPDSIKSAKGIILSGGPSSVSDEGAPSIDPMIFRLGVPVLGLCYGHQLMAKLLGGSVKGKHDSEYGIAELGVRKKEGIFSGLSESEQIWMSHGDSVESLPEGFEIIGSTTGCKAAAIADFKRNFYGLQFHAEVTHTPNGMKMLSNFIDICRCEKNWSMRNFVEQSIIDIRNRTKGKNVFLLVSGGVDSTVAFALLNKALGIDRVYGLYVDNGFTRNDEAVIVEKLLKKHGFSNFHVADASKKFLDAVKETYDPERKRTIIGNVFIDVVNEEVKSLNLAPDEWLIGQGTIYPDTIESKGTKHADRIKTHHNRVAAIQKLIDEGKLIEPIAELYKDEVRKVGYELGLSKEIVGRHPFPGPGLAVRVLCSDGSDTVKDQDAINDRINRIAAKYGLHGKVLPVRSVGVQGDSRSYSHPAVIIGDAGWDILEKVSTELTNSIKEINRIVWLIAPKELGKITVKKAYLTRERLDLEREADDISMRSIEGFMDEVWQFPTVLVPLSLHGGECIVLRPVFSKEAMTARFAALPKEAVFKMAEKLMKLKGIDAVFYDITHKPPGTIEWE